MDKSNESLTKKQKRNLEHSQRWLRRAQSDFNMFKRLVPVKKDTHKIFHCQDPAMAVYLLQQSIEKATKAIAVATGRYTHYNLRRQGHNSLAVLLNFYQKTLVAMQGKSSAISFFSALSGIDINNGIMKIQSLKAKAQKNLKDKKNGEALYREQYASASSTEIESILNFLLSIRKGFINGLTTLFDSHGKIVIPARQLDIDSMEGLFESLTSELKNKMNLPNLSESQQKSMLEFMKTLSPNGIIADENTNKYEIKRREHEDQTLGQWSMIALLMLAAFTFPHESTTRYPRPLRMSALPAGCEDYTLELGIVKSLGLMGYVTALALNDLNKELPAISSFFTMMESQEIK